MSCSGRNESSSGRRMACPAPPGIVSVPEPEIEIGSALILQGRREIVIRHGAQRYRLRITAGDKLILTK